jgi:hypothetical protein
MKHKWTVMLVVLVTTIVTAQEAVKQYDDLKAQAAAWATSRLWASLLSTSSAPEEESPEEQRADCYAKEPTGDDSRQPQSLMSTHVNDTENINGDERAAVNQTIRSESRALEDKHHFDANEATAETFERTSEVALLTEQSNVEAEEASLPETLSAEQDTTTTQDDAVDEDSPVHADQEEAHSISRALKRAVAEEVSTGVDASTPVQETRAAVETRVQARAIRRAVKALHDSIDRSRRIELRIIRRERRVDPHNAAHISLRAENSSGPQANTFSDARSAQINSQHTASLNAERRMCE